MSALPIIDRGILRHRVGAAETQREVDSIAVEEPLELRIAGEPIAITMRTPGDDHRLALGFLFAEGIIDAASDLGKLAHCGDVGDPSFENTIDALPAPGTALDPERVATSRRGTLTTASCGVCGRRSIDDLLDRCAPLPAAEPVEAGLIHEAAARLAGDQRVFEATGAVHGAAALTAAGRGLASAEDVGRHNAVDKVVGALLEERRVGRDAVGEPPALLMVSGRISFEIVQKAAVARIPIVAGVSGTTSLAVDLAEATGIALAAFVRDGSANLYSHAERIRVGE